MKKRIKLLQVWKDHTDKEHAIGTVLLVDETTAKELLNGDNPIACSYTEAEEQAEKDAAEARREELRGALRTELKEILPQLNSDGRLGTVAITVHEKADDDPVGGYLPERRKEAWTADEVEYAFGLFAMDVRNAKQSGQYSDRMVAARERAAKQVEKGIKDGTIAKDVIATDIDSDGGFLIPTEIARTINVGALEASKVRPSASKLSLGTNALEMPIVEDYDRSSGLVYGGIILYWTGEEETLTESKPKFGAVRVQLHKLTGLAKVTGEMLRWSAVSVGSWLMPMFTNGIGWKEDGAFISGNGSGMPLGVLNAPNLISVAKETGQTADTIVTENVLKMYSRHLTGTGMFIANRTAFPQLAVMKIDVGTGGAPLWLPMNSIAGQPHQTLMGLPLEYSERVPVLGDEGDIGLFDFRRYVVADDRKGPEVAQSIHLDFDSDKTAFRFIKYVGGMPMDKKAVTPEKGDTLSPFVVVAARA